MLHQISVTKISQKVILFLAACTAVLCFMVIARPQQTSAAACAPSGDRGVVTHTLTDVTAGTYRIWSRMMSAGGGNDSYFIEITRNSNNNKDCFVVGDSTQISSSNWTWVDYQNGSSSNKLNYSFPANGSYTVKLIGREDNVKLDRVMFLSNGCTPTGNGDNCAVIPNQAPTVQITSPSNNATLTSSPVTIQANASDSDGTIQRVEFQIDNGQVHTDYSAPYTYSWAISSANNGQHTIKVTAYDNEGQASSPATINVTVNIPVADTTPPNVSWSSPANGTTVTTSPVTLTATASDTSGIKRVEFYYGSTYIGASSNTSSPYSYNWNISSIPNGTYQLKAKAIDNSPNENSKETTPISITINKPDVESPTTPTNFRSTGTTTTSVSLAWNASTDNVGVVAYELRRNGQIVNSNIAGTSYTDNNLQPSTTYQYTLRAKDAAGNVSGWTGTVTAQTQAAPDTTPPSAPTNVTAVATGSTSITVSWTASTDNVGVAKYRIYRNGSQIAEVNAPATSYGVTGLTPSTQYSFYVRAVDAAGNISNNSNTATATTQAAADTTKPSVNITSPSNGATVSGTTTISANATDNVGVTKVEFLIDGAVVHTDNSSPFSYAWNTTTKTNGSYTLTARAYDAANNVQTSVAITVTVNNGSSGGGGTLKPGDVDGDNKVGITDAIAVALNWGRTGVSRAQGDLDGNGVVNIGDAIIVALNWGK